MPIAPITHGITVAILISLISVREIIELHILGKLNQQPNPTGQSLSARE